MKKSTSLKEFLNQKDFYKIKLHLISSDHYKIVAKINNTKGWFILDTGASTTFVAQTAIEKFKLDIEPQKIKAYGAGPEEIQTKISKNNKLRIGQWVFETCNIACIDLNPINRAFKSADLAEVDGIIGADVLKKGKAVIDYDKNYLYLK
ncbi:MAG: retropepsin-like aspartic protease [Flavobacteriaceae bacterium]